MAEQLSFGLIVTDPRAYRAEAAKKQRRCLSCSSTFNSAGPGNRICGRCKSLEHFTCAPVEYSLVTDSFQERNAMAYRLTSAQRCVLADDTRAAVLGWLLTDPDVGQQARRIEGKATTIVGFSFSRFASMALDEIGSDYRPRSTTPGIVFPLTIAEGFALANNIELEMANEDHLSAAGLIAAYSPYGQPEVCSRDWRAHVGCLAALGLSVDCPTLARPWRDIVRDQLNDFRHAVALAATPILVSAE